MSSRKANRPPECGVEKLDGSGLQCSSSPETNTFGGTLKTLTALGQDHREVPLVQLEERDELAEDLGDIAPVDLVDKKDERLVGAGLSGSTDSLEDARPGGEGQADRCRWEWA